MDRAESLSQSRVAFRGGLLICVVGSLALLSSWLARGPDFDLEFNREVATQATTAQVDAALRDLREWPHWFHSLASARVLLASGADGGFEVTSGEDIALEIDPMKGERRKYTLHARVLEYVPAKKLSLRVTYDSKHQLTELFNRLDWTVELNPGFVQGSAHAHTSHWRSRFFGRVAEIVLMNQVFYPDLFKLAKTGEPTDDSLPPVD